MAGRGEVSSYAVFLIRSRDRKFWVVISAMCRGVEGVEV